MGEMIDLKTTKAYLSKPEGSGPFPALIVLQEWWGLNENIKEIVDRFAKEGFLALAPDLYRGTVAQNKVEAQSLVDNLSLEAGLLICLEAVDYLKSVGVKKIGVTGFCMGGKYALYLASKSPEISACVPFYGHVPQPPQNLEGIKCPVLGNYAQADDGISAEEVQLLKDTLTKYGVEHEIIVYRGAHHSFMNDQGENYNPAVAKQAWYKTINFLKKYLTQ